MTTPPLDLPALREIAEAATPGPWVSIPGAWGGDGYIDRAAQINGEPEIAVCDHDADRDYIAAFDPPTVLALLDRVESGDSWTTVYPCKTSHEQPYDFKQCETHDRTFPLDGDCDHKGKSYVDWQDDREQEQRARALRAEDRAETAEKKVAAAEELLRNHAFDASADYGRDEVEPVEVVDAGDLRIALDGGA